MINEPNKRITTDGVALTNFGGKNKFIKGCVGHHAFWPTPPMLIIAVATSARKLPQWPQYLQKNSDTDNFCVMKSNGGWEGEVSLSDIVFD